MKIQVSQKFWVSGHESSHISVITKPSHFWLAEMAGLAEVCAGQLARLAADQTLPGYYFNLVTCEVIWKFGCLNRNLDVGLHVND